MNIPSGNVTFLFTDIEGSTKLSQLYPDTYQKALEKHHAIMNNAVNSNNGYTFEIVGDAFCCTFEKAEDAVKAAVDAQTGLASEKWEDAVIKIRIGIHSGAAEWNGKKYMGYITLARSARVMSTAYGEQIIISNSTYELARDKFDAVKEKNISFRDLGERRLKDVIQPIKLFQIESPGLRSDFPPLKTLDARPNNLPVQLTNFIGKEDEINRLKTQLKKTHLLTLTGSGGSGKSRMALQIAAEVIDDFANGVWLIELASLSEPSLLPQEIMNIFGLKDEPNAKLEDTLFKYFKDKDILLILDNCEHLIEQCADLAEKLLTRSPKLKIIATSREALRCSGERTHRVLSLDTPDPKENLTPEKLIQFESVRLFNECALAVDEDFRVNKDNADDLAQICYQLDGIPLAIELAAARIKILSVEQIYERLNDRFSLLTGGKRTSLPRQQTLKALVDWSYDLLSEKERILWRRLSVFSGGWTLEAAEEVCSDAEIIKQEIVELLNQLTEKSIIIFEREKERYKILESLKQYGEDKLEDAIESENIFLKHLIYFMEFSEIGELKLKGSEVQTWLEILEFEHSNIQSAIVYSLKKETEIGAQLASAMGIFWQIRGHYSTGRKLLENILNSEIEFSKPVIGKTMLQAGNLSLNQGDIESAQKFFEDSLNLHQQLEDNIGIASSLINLGNVALTLGNYENAQKLYKESIRLLRKSGDKHSIAKALHNLGTISYSQGNYDQSKEFYEESLKLRREINDMLGIASSLTNLSNIEYNRGIYKQALKLVKESLPISRELGDKRLISSALNIMGNIEFIQENYEQAQKFIDESIALQKEMGDKRGVAYTLTNLVNFSFARENYEEAQKLSNEILTISREIGDKRLIAYALNSLGNSEYSRSNFVKARKYYQEGLEIRIEIGEKSGILESIIGFAGIFFNNNNFSDAVKLLGAADRELKSTGRVLETYEQKLFDQTKNKLMDRLSEEEFKIYFEEGKTLSLEMAVGILKS